MTTINELFKTKKVIEWKEIDELLTESERKEWIEWEEQNRRDMNNEELQQLGRELVESFLGIKVGGK